MHDRAAVTGDGAPPPWTSRRERGAVPMIRLIVWIALRIGRPAARLLLFPICLYFLAFSIASRNASRRYLARVLQRQPGIADIFRHYHAFASCLLDRVFFLNDQLHLFDLDIHGAEIVDNIVASGSGCLLLGAHLGSFEATRAVGRQRPGLRISLVMYEENARKIGSVLNAINPALAMDVISLGRSGSMIEVGRRLEQGHLVGLLADRSLGDEGCARFPFLGSSASFPLGPFRMAALLGRPVVLMVGLYRGGRRYEVFFEPLIDASDLAGGSMPAADEAMRRYVERLEHYCREAPYNWFNFYDFWA